MVTALACFYIGLIAEPGTSREVYELTHSYRLIFSRRPSKLFLSDP